MDKDRLLKYFKSSTIIAEGTFTPVCELISNMTDKRYTIAITHEMEKRGERINKILNIE